MKFETLNHIHKLLVEEEAKRHGARKIANDALEEARDHAAENIPTLEALDRKAFEAWREACDALADFNNREW